MNPQTKILNPKLLSNNTRLTVKLYSIPVRSVAQLTVGKLVTKCVTLPPYLRTGLYRLSSQPAKTYRLNRTSSMARMLAPKND